MPLSEEENQTLTQVGPGTPMGDLLRRYWQPIAAVTELDANPVKAVRLLGEYLVLYRDQGGTYGLIQRACAHRLTDMAFGIVEEYGLRCPLHGWLYSETGQCLDMPLEDEPFCEEIKVVAYPVQVKAGVVWAYLGPEPAPLVPDWEPFTWEDGLVQVVFTELPCNWFQCQENAIDPIDAEWFHTSLAQSMEAPPPPVWELDIGFDEFDYGFVYRRAQKGASGQPAAPTVGRTCLWPNGVFAGNSRSCHFEWRVPMDDTNTLSVAWFVDRVAPGAEVPEQRYFHWYAPAKDEDSADGITSHALNRAFVIWLHQQPIVDRTEEFLVEGDEGVVMLRNKFFSQIGLIADGGEPKATLRDPALNRRLRLPFTQPKLEAPQETPVEEDERLPADGRFPFLAGQPEDVAEAYRKVIGTWHKREDAEKP